jgi:uroporphyrinogen-III synthase
MSLHIFITREEDAVRTLVQLLSKNGFKVKCQPLIQTEGVSFSPKIPLSDWVFFSSAHAVNYFFAQNPEIDKQRFAAIGSSTAASFPSDINVSFIGNNIDTMVTAKEFSELVDSQTVLFPGSEQSLRTIQSVLPKDQVLDLICYRTIEAPIRLGFFDILVFSSPSNVRAYFQCNKAMDHQHILAYGPSTAAELRRFGVEKITIPSTLSDEDIYKAINQLSVS